MPFTDLDQARDDACYRIHTYAQELNGDPANDPASLFAIAWEHRQLAICHLLQDGDAQRFQTGLRRAGLTWVHLLRLMDAGMSIPPRMQMGSKWHALASVVAANDPRLCQAIATRFPMRCDEEREYAAAYFPLAVMQQVIESTDATALLAFCDRWLGAIDGEGSSALEVWRAMATGNTKEFHHTFANHAAHRMDQMTAYRKSFSCVKTIAATEGGLFIDALAMLQIARGRGLDLPPPQPMCPLIALVPTASQALPTDAWRTFE